MSERVRLDAALAARGLVPSRARARDAVLRGAVAVNGVRAQKPGQMVSPTDKLELADPAAGHVSRAALKLIAGLEAAGFHPAGKVCLDLGASTGGFTQVLAERGAKRIYAVDVGHGQIHPGVAELEQVVVLEGVNARDLDESRIPEPIDLLVCDVSFVSVVKIIEAPSTLCGPEAEAIVLVKPQFEVGRAHVGKGGIVSSGPHVEAALGAVTEKMAALGWVPVTRIVSPLKGGDGNTEYVLGFRKG